MLSRHVKSIQILISIMKTAYSYDLDLGPKRGCQKNRIMGNINERNCSFGAQNLKAYASFSVYYEFSVNICKSPFAESLTCLTLISPQTFLSLRLGGMCVSLLPFCSAFPLPSVPDPVDPECMFLVGGWWPGSVSHLQSVCDEHELNDPFPPCTGDPV